MAISSKGNGKPGDLMPVLFRYDDFMLNRMGRKKKKWLGCLRENFDFKQRKKPP
jgi:hypothetical protein